MLLVYPEWLAGIPCRWQLKQSCRLFIECGIAGPATGVIDALVDEAAVAGEVEAVEVVAAVELEMGGVVAVVVAGGVVVVLLPLEQASIPHDRININAVPVRIKISLLLAILYPLNTLYY